LENIRQSANILVEIQAERDVRAEDCFVLRRLETLGQESDLRCTTKGFSVAVDRFGLTGIFLALFKKAHFGSTD
jgi:hypothetical protein